MEDIEEEIQRLKDSIENINNEIQKIKDKMNKNINNDSNDIVLFSLYLIIVILFYSII
jgi:signal transduction protein with GAF and PtsI domain